MRALREPLYDKDQTGDRMYDLVIRFARDLESVMVGDRSASDLTIEEFFDFVRRLPYRRDTRPIEIVARPYYIISRMSSGLDCKKKGILIAAWAECNNVPWRFIASSIRKDGRKHHVFPQLYIRGKWRNVDATYPEYRLYGSKSNLTSAEILSYGD